MALPFARRSCIAGSHTVSTSVCNHYFSSFWHINCTGSQNLGSEIQFNATLRSWTRKWCEYFDDTLLCLTRRHQPAQEEWISESLLENQTGIRKMISAISIRETRFGQLVRSNVIGKWPSRIWRSANGHSVKTIWPLDLGQLSCRVSAAHLRSVRKTSKNVNLKIACLQTVLGVAILARLLKPTCFDLIRRGFRCFDLH